MIKIAVNPKEHFKKYMDKTANKKQKGMRKDAAGMTFESYAQIIISIRDNDASVKNQRK